MGGKIQVVLLLTGIFFINFTARVIFSPLMPTIEQDLHLGHTEAGTIFLFLSVGYCLALIGSSFVSARIGHRRTVILSALFLGAALGLVGISRSLWGIRLAILVLGMSTGLYLASGIATITSLFSPNHWGKVIAIHELAPNLGLLLAPLIAEIGLRWASWWQILIGLGGLSLTAGMVYAIWGQGGSFKGTVPGLNTLKDLGGRKSFWIMLLLFVLALGGSQGVYSMLPLSMVSENGFTRGQANNLLAWSRLSGPFVAMAAGWAGDRFGLRVTLAAVILGSGLTTLGLGLTNSLALVLMIFGQAAFMAGFFPVGLAALSRIGRPEERSVAVAYAIPLAYLLGGGVIPTIIGHFGETRTFALGFILYGTLMCLGPILAKYLTFYDAQPAPSNNRPI